MKRLPLIALAFAGFTGFIKAQAPGVPIEQPGESTGSKITIERAGKLKDEGKLLGVDRVKELMAAPVAEKVTLPPAKTEALSRADIYEQARQSRVKVGWFYLCHKCQHWHTRLAGGYPVTDDGVIATCHHVVAPQADMREGYLIVVDAEGVVTPVTGVIADNAEYDICLLRASGGKFRAMPLNDAVRPGDAAYCLSDPLGVTGYFSDGMVNRFFRKPGGKGSHEEALRLHVSTDWAPGSSGSPVLDQCGNVIGHVSTISSMTGGPRRETPPAGPGEATPPRRGGTQIVLHEASPARGVMALLKTASATAENQAAELPKPSADPPQ